MRLTLTGGGCEIKRTAPPVRGFLARLPLTGRSRPVASSSRASGPAECWNSRPAPRVLSPDPRAVPNVHDAGSSVPTEERAMIETVRHAGTTVRTDRKSGVEGKVGAVRVDTGGVRNIKKKKKKN